MLLWELVLHTPWMDIGVDAGGGLGVGGKAVGMLVSWSCNYQPKRHINPLADTH